MVAICSISAHHFYVTGFEIFRSNPQNILTNIKSNGNLSKIESDTIASINEIFDIIFPLVLSSIKEKTDHGKT